MNPWKQFWTIVKFQVSLDSSLLWMPFLFALPVIFYVIPSRPTLDLVVSATNILFVLVLGKILLSPGIHMAKQIAAFENPGTELLLICPIDRRLLYRTRSIMFYVLILVTPIGVFLYALAHPSLVVDPRGSQAILQNIPDSAFVSNAGLHPYIVIPRGNPLVEGWHLWIYVAGAIVVQIAMIGITPIKFLKYGLYTMFLPLWFLAISAPLYYSYLHLTPVFFDYLAHQPLVWALTIMGLILAQPWCERCFVRQEQ